MNILIPDIWLRDWLKTNAKAKEIAECLTISGPSVEKIIDSEIGPLYSIEVTTNRVDCASVYGIAREAKAILTRFGYQAELISKSFKPLVLSERVKYLEVSVDPRLCLRFSAVLIKNIKLGHSSRWLADRLRAIGIRSINNVVDISNYVMHDIGQPVHTFDYDKILGHKMILRESKKHEKITTLDGKIHTLLGDDIVIEDGAKRLIDLAGIMGGGNSAVDEKSKNILLFVQTYNPANIRKTAMSLAQRTEAAELFEKGIDEELVYFGLQKGIELFKNIALGTIEKQILDIYPNPYKEKNIKISFDFIYQKIGIKIDKEIIFKFLKSLGFEVKVAKDYFIITVPSFRAKDISLPEDIIEEIARLYGYQNLPSQIMTGPIPQDPPEPKFDFENKVKWLLKGLGGVEVYTPSLVAKELIQGQALKLKNPLGTDSEYLRTSLLPSLVSAAKENSEEKETFHLFEIANIYLPKKADLPEEKMMVAGIMANSTYIKAKGIIEAFFDQLNISPQYFLADKMNFLANQRIGVKSKNQTLGSFGILEENNYFYYEFSLDELVNQGKQTRSFKPIALFPPQIEDLTFSFPQKTYIGEVIEAIKKQKYIAEAELTDIYKNYFTFTIYYQSPHKTLSNAEVEKIRKEMLSIVKEKFGGIQKD